MNASDAPLDELGFTVSGFISRPREEVFEAVADPEILSRYFTTGGAVGRMVSGATVQWDFADFPGAFLVRVIDVVAPERLVFRWDGDASAVVGDDGTEVVFEFREVDGGARTEVRVTERAWRPTPGGAEAAFGNCMGWTGMLAAMKAWLEYSIDLREGFYK